MVSNTWRTRLHEVAHLAGVKKAVRPHILRHTGVLLYTHEWRRPFQLAENSRSLRYDYDSKVYSNV
jgi:integrase/recombinase XerD